jgi:hypothetical protein
MDATNAVRPTPLPSSMTRWGEARLLHGWYCWIYAARTCPPIQSVFAVESSRLSCRMWRRVVLKSSASVWTCFVSDAGCIFCPFIYFILFYFDSGGGWTEEMEYGLFRPSTRRATACRLPPLPTYCHNDDDDDGELPGIRSKSLEFRWLAT